MWRVVNIVSLPCLLMGSLEDKMNPKSPDATIESAKKSESRFTSAIRSALLVFLLFFPLTFLHLLVHEGGHALVNVFYKIPNTSIYIHPFSFSGFSRPMFDYHNAWSHLGGPTVSILVALILFIIFWRRRTFTNLLLLVFIAWTPFWEGMGFMDILGGTGDFFNVTRVTSLPVGMFFAIDLLLFITGIILFVSLMPLFGLKPKDLNALWVFPAGMGLFGLVGLAVAYAVVPVTPFAIQYKLVNEIQVSANFRPLLMAVAGLLFAGLYVTLYRAVCRKLPAALRTDIHLLTWRDLRWPANWALASVVIGLILIT
jgi:hypothetical protein